MFCLLLAYTPVKIQRQLLCDQKCPSCRPKATKSKENSTSTLKVENVSPVTIAMKQVVAHTNRRPVEVLWSLKIKALISFHQRVEFTTEILLEY